MSKLHNIFVECGMSLLGVMVAQICFLHGTDFGYKHFMVATTIVMELVITSYFIASLIEFSLSTLRKWINGNESLSTIVKS